VFENGKIFGREPAYVFAALVSLISLVGSFGLNLFTAENAAATVIVVNAVAAILVAWTTRPIAPGLFSALLSAVIALGVTYGLELPQETVVALNGAIYPLLMFISRGQVSPIETAVTNKSQDPLAWPRAGAEVRIDGNRPV
jgi:hypothetical protein